MRFEPLGARLLVEVLKTEETTPGGIVIPDAARERPHTARVVEAPPGEDAGVSVGDRIVFVPYAGTEIKLDGAKRLILDADDVLGVLKEG